MSVFTARDFASRFNISPQRVIQLLRGESSAEIYVKGQLTYAWRLADLSREKYNKLEKRAKSRGYRNLAQMMSGNVKSWEPKRQVPDAEKSLAGLYRDVLAPILRMFCRTSTKAELIRKAKRAGKTCECFSSLSAKVVRRLIEAAIARDSGDEKWDRWELYLAPRFDFGAAHTRIRGQRSSSHDDSIAAVDLNDAISSAGEYPTQWQRNAIWHSAFCALAAGMTKRAIIEKLLETNYFAQRYASVEHSFNLKHRRWTDKGGKPETLIDQRKTNHGKTLAVLTPAQQAHVHKLVLATDPNDGTRVSVSMALRMFAQSDQCPDELAAVINKKRSSKHIITPTLKRQARITAETKMLHRGNKTFSLGAYSQPRKLTWIDAGGIERPILGGDIFEADDMTPNQPWYVEWNDPNDPCSVKYGVRLLRGQLLMMIDVGSQRILGFLLLARPKDSYRAEDIWSWFGQVFADVGLPRVGIRLERGIWEAKAIHGLPVIDSTWDNKRRIGGLAALGVRAITSYSPKTKSIESLFNQLQKVLGVLGVQVGRKRGEFEKPTRDYLACRAGNKHPADCGFLHADEIARRVANACMFLNGDCREGEVYRGIPDELWKRHVSSGSPLRSVASAHAWVFMPYKRELTIGNGMVRARFAEHECSYYFTHPELFASLGRGYHVVVCFDPALPQQGAVIFNNEAGPRAHTGAGVGEFLGVAEFVDRVPQFSALDGCDDEAGYERRRRFTEQCRKAYRAIPLPGARGSSATIARDDRGNETRVEFAGGPASKSRSPTGPANAEHERGLLSLDKRDASSRRGEALISAAQLKKEEAEREALAIKRVAKLERDYLLAGGCLYREGGDLDFDKMDRLRSYEESDRQ